MTSADPMSTKPTTADPQSTNPTTADPLAELSTLLSHNSRPDVRLQALRVVHGLPPVLLKTLLPSPLLTLLDTPLSPTELVLICESLTNGVSETTELAELCLESGALMERLHRPDLLPTRHALRLLNNLTCEPRHSERYLSQAQDDLLQSMMDRFVNGGGAEAAMLGCIIRNLTQCPMFRARLASDYSSQLHSMLTVCSKVEDAVRRQLALDIAYNMCLDSALHPTIMSEPLSLCLLRPLHSADYELDDEEQDKLPVELQYFDGQPDPVLGVRKKASAALYQLTGTLPGRVFTRPFYPILREAHKREENEDVKEMLENAVGLLIRDEEELNCDDVKGMEKPYDMNIEKLKM